MKCPNPHLPEHDMGGDPFLVYVDGGGPFERWACTECGTEVYVPEADR